MTYVITYVEPHPLFRASLGPPKDAVFGTPKFLNNAKKIDLIPLPSTKKQLALIYLHAKRTENKRRLAIANHTI